MNRQYGGDTNRGANNPTYGINNNNRQYGGNSENPNNSFSDSPWMTSSNPFTGNKNTSSNNNFNDNSQSNTKKY